MGSREGAPWWVSGKEGKAGNRWTVPPPKQVLVGQGPVMGAAELEPWAGQDGVCFPSEPLHQAWRRWFQCRRWFFLRTHLLGTSSSEVSRPLLSADTWLFSPEASSSISFCDILTQRSHLFVNINTNTYIFILPHPPPTEVYYTHPSKSLFPLARVLWRFLHI